MDVKLAIAQSLSGATGLPAEELAGYIETPPDPSMGDYAFLCFRLAKALKKAPPAIAALTAATVRSTCSSGRSKTLAFSMPRSVTWR